MPAPEVRPPSPAPGVFQRHDLASAGLATGLAGGVAMLLVAMAAANGQGLGVLGPLEVIGETFVGPGALGAGARVAYGAVVHLATAALLGLVFASLVPREHPLAGGMGLGVGVALLMMGLLAAFVTPWANPGLRSGFQAIGGAWVIAHAVFGAVIGTAPALRRRLARERRAAPPPRAVLRPRAPVAPPRNA